MSNNLKVVKSKESIDFDVEFLTDGKKKTVIKRPKPFPTSQHRFNREKTVLSKWEKFNKSRPKNIRIPPSFILDNCVHQQYIPNPYDLSSRSVEELTDILKKWYKFWGIKDSRKNLREELGSTLSFIEGILPDEKKKSLIYKTAVDILKEKIGDGKDIHSSFIHGNLLFDHLRKDEEGNIYLMDFDFSGDGSIEDDVSRFEVDEITNSWKHSLKPTEIEKTFDQVELSLASSGMLKREATKQFRAINYLKRTPYTRYYLREAEEDLFDMFSVNAVNTLNDLSPISPPRPKKLINVLNISWGLPGGVNTYIQTYMKPLERLGFNFVEIGYDIEDNSPKFSVRKDDGTFSQVSGGEVEKILQQGFDVINIHNYSAGVPINHGTFLHRLLRLREQTNCKLVYTMHGCLKEFFHNLYGITDDTNPYLKAEKELLTHSDKIIGNSYLRQKISQLYGSNIVSKHETVEPASNIQSYIGKIPKGEVAKLRKKLGDDSTWIISYFGRVTQQKGVRELVDAISNVNTSLRPYGAKAKLLLIGPKENDVDEHIERHRDFVSYLGEKKREELTRYILASHITVQPTYYDSFNFSILESLLCSTPAISTDVTGPEYYFNSYVTRAVWSDNYEKRVQNLSSALLYAIRNYENVRNAAKKGQKELLFKHNPVKTAYDLGWEYLDLLS